MKSVASQLSILRVLVFGLLSCHLAAAHALPQRNDVLIVVNDNSIDSPLVGEYYAQQRGIDPANIVHVNVPAGYFIEWNDFRILRDQLIAFMQKNTLTDPAMTPVVCADGDPPYYCQASTDQLRLYSRIRYIVTTRGVPTRMRVAGSTLSNPTAPASVDNYLKYWLINYFADDVQLDFREREQAFADGGGMREVNPSVDRELIVGRIDGLDLNAAKALIDRTLAAEKAGIYGIWYGSTQYWDWKNEASGQKIYPPLDMALSGWRYGLGQWREDRPECVAYLNVSGQLPEGKAPADCRIQFNDDFNVSVQSRAGISYPAPGNSQSRIPLAVDALGYQGFLDGQAALGGFNTLLNWRKDAQCSVTLCKDAADSAACKAASTDFFAELNTNCVGVADGFMAYNHSSYPLSYLTVWPTAWQGPVSGDLHRLAFPRVRQDVGADDLFSLWVMPTDQVASPLCYPTSDFSPSASQQPCEDTRKLYLRQLVQLGATTLDGNNPPSYQVSLQYQHLALSPAVSLRVKMIVYEAGAGNKTVDYGFKTLAAMSADTTGWTTASVQFTLDPARHTANTYDRIELIFDTDGAFSGQLGIDTVSLKRVTDNTELLANGSFADGHRSVSSGDHAANFLNRLNGVAVWGSVGHHQSGGCAFCFNELELMTYFLRGLPLGDAVWFDESNNSGILYGDPLYSPVAVRLMPLDPQAIQSGSVDLRGDTVNGRDLLQVNTTYRVDVCAADDFYVCDQQSAGAQSWQPTGISGAGGRENMLLGVLDTTTLAQDDFVIRLQVDSIHQMTGKQQSFADYLVVPFNDAPVAVSATINMTEPPGEVRGLLIASDEETPNNLTYTIVSPAKQGNVFLPRSTSGLYIYTPQPNAKGTDSFSFKVNDGQQDSAVATVTIQFATAADPVPDGNAGAGSNDIATVTPGKPGAGALNLYYLMLLFACHAIARLRRYPAA